jgi:hypothetical protein
LTYNNVIEKERLVNTRTREEVAPYGPHTFAHMHCSATETGFGGSPNHKQDPAILQKVVSEDATGKTDSSISIT